MNTKNLPSPELLRKLLRYDPDSGKLYWRERTPDMFDDVSQSADHNCRAWNGRYADKEAFTFSMASGYLQGAIFNRKYYAHRVAWAIQNNEHPITVDHINGIRGDNRIVNLRSVSLSENLRNKKLQSNNISGVCGVFWEKSRGKWLAQIYVHGKLKHIGYFINKNDAIFARKNAEKKFGYHENHGRLK